MKRLLPVLLLFASGAFAQQSSPPALPPNLYTVPGGIPSSPSSGGSSSSSSLTANNVIDAGNFSTYGVYADTFAVYDATTTNTNPTVTIGTNDPCFLSTAAASPAQHIEVTSWTGADTAYASTTLTMAETTVSAFNSCHSVNVTVAPTANCAGTCTLVVGHVDDTGLDAVDTAATTHGGQCHPVQLPAGILWTDRQHFNGAAVANNCSNGFIVTPANSIRANDVKGWGPLSTVLFMGSTFNLTCGGNSCFFGQRGQEITELSLWGAGYSPTNPSDAVSMIACGIDCRLIDIQIAGFYWDDQLLVGFNVSSGGAAGIISDAVGKTPCKFVNSFISQAAVPNFCAFGKGSGIIIDGSGKTVTYGIGGYSSLNSGVSSPAISVGPSVQAVWDSFGDFATCQTTAANLAGVSITGALGSTVSLHDFTVVNCGSATTQAGITVNNTSTVYNYGSIINGSAVTGAVILNGTNALWVDYAPQASTYTGGFNVIGAGRYVGGTTIANVSTAQVNVVGATTLYSVPATVAGTKEGAFRVSASVNINTAGTSGTLTANVIFVDGSNGATTTTVALCTTAAISNALPNNCQGSAIVHAAPNTVIQWSITGTVTAGTLSYVPWYRVEVL